jgi:hypothetical protein
MQPVIPACNVPGTVDGSSLVAVIRWATHTLQQLKSPSHAAVHASGPAHSVTVRWQVTAHTEHMHVMHSLSQESRTLLQLEDLPSRRGGGALLQTMGRPGADGWPWSATPQCVGSCFAR